MSSIKYPTGNCCLGDECKFPRMELRPTHTCSICNGIVHVLCCNFNQSNDNISCPKCVSNNFSPQSKTPQVLLTDHIRGKRLYLESITTPSSQTTITVPLSQPTITSKSNNPVCIPIITPLSQPTTTSFKSTRTNSNLKTIIKCHEALIETNKPWLGRMYLPPCQCYSKVSSCTKESSCSSSQNTTIFDFSKHEELSLPDLFDICKFIDNNNRNYNDVSTYLCQKYSPLSLKNDVINISNKAEKINFIKKSASFQEKYKLLRADLQLLWPLSGSSFIFKFRCDGGTIKLQIICNMGLCYRKNLNNNNRKKTEQNRQCTTSKPLNSIDRCKFSLNIHFDIILMSWYITKKGNTIHENRKNTNLEVYKIGEHQLSTSMISEIQKLEKANVSQPIQQNLLLTNNNVSISLQTIRNKSNSLHKEHLDCCTDAEKLLASLKTDPHITYFAMFAESLDNELLTINKSKRKRMAKNSNIRISGYVQNQKMNKSTSFIPETNDAVNEVVSQLIVRNTDSHKIQVLLAVVCAHLLINTPMRFPDFFKIWNLEICNSVCILNELFPKKF